MKIAILRKKYTFHGGAEGFSGSFIERLAADGHEVHIFAIKWQSDDKHGNIHFHKVPVIALNSFLRDFSFAISSYLMLKRRRKHFDIIQTHDKTIYQDLYRAGDGCHIEWLKQRWRRIGFLEKLSIILNPYHWLILELERSIFKQHRYKKIIAISEMVKRNIIENYRVSPSDIEVIYNGVDIEKYHPRNRDKYRSEIRQKHGLKDTDFVVLFMGSGFERKGVKYLIEAVGRIPEAVTLLIVGKGSEKVYRKVIPAKAGIQRKGLDSLVKPENDNAVTFQNRHKIIFCGPQKENYKYYAAADVFVFPTIYEPFGNVHLEALASGLPVITTKNSGAAEIIKDAVHGFVINKPEDVASIAEKIGVFINDRDALESMSKKARQLAEEFTFEKHISKIKDLYERVISGRNSREQKK